MIENVSGFGLIAIDKAAGRVLFLDPASLEIRRVLDDLPPKPHELLILPGSGKAYVPIFGDGVHGDNPQPQHHIAVIDLQRQAVSKLIDISPYRAPHTARKGMNGLIYCCCEDSAAVVVIDPESDRMVGAIKIASDKVHRLATIPGRMRLITENEEDATLCLVQMNQDSGHVLKTISAPSGLNGIDAAPSRPWVVATSGERLEFYAFDQHDLGLLRTIPLAGHHKPAQIVRYRADGEVLAVIGDFDPVASFYDADLNHLFTTEVQDKPLDGAFTPDGRHFLVANEDSGSITIIDLARGCSTAHVDVPEGCEVLSYYPEVPVTRRRQ
ncbi:YncE family protein [Frateuria aurantia]